MDAMDASYVDDGALREQDGVPLPVFLADKDRAQLTGRGQPFFSGREKEINAFRSMANALLLGRLGNATLVVEGPPGAGKSALMAQFQEEMRTLPPTGSGARRWLPVTLDGALAMSPQAIMSVVDGAIAERLAHDLIDARDGDEEASHAQRLAALIGKGTLDNARSVAQKILDRGVSAMGFAIGGREAPPPSTVLKLADLRGRHWSGWQIVLLIDEAQGISPHGPAAVGGTLSSIHQGLVHVPLSFCAFGLPGTADALSDVGVSRASIGHDLPLSGLDNRASRMAVRRCFSQYGVAHAEAWERAILERSANWPQHLATYLHAALTILHANAPSLEVMGDAQRSPLSEAIALGDAGRKAYYGRRLRGMTRDNPLFRDYAADLAEALRGADRPPLESELTRNLMQRHGVSVEVAADFLRKARHNGLLETDDEGRCSMPIPSFANHLLGEAAHSANGPAPA
ncbi:MAG: ATP-binding protein [Gammaproteobacteria bacterium]|nr:ATP-binding protein [Gammaproteobacteria bacterium]MYK27288.1 ATP-binding protein [Gammaproteobacteria bacterium]